MSSESIDSLAQLFKQERKSLKLTQKELADNFGVSAVHISYIENKKRVPSRKLLKQLYALKQSPLPENIITLLADIKSEPLILGGQDTVYELKAKGNYTFKHLNRLLKKEPGNLVYIMGLFHLYKEQGKLKQSQDILIEAQSQDLTPHDKKWLEAYALQLEQTESGYAQALKSMQTALDLFDAQHPHLDLRGQKTKSELLFRYATIHYDLGVHLFFTQDPTDPQIQERIETQFQAALKKHETLRQYYLYPYSQLDYANLFYWLATLKLYSSAKKTETTETQIQLWECFVQESKSAMLFDYTESLKTFPKEPVYSMYSAEFMLTNSAFLALAHGRLALLKHNKAEVSAHLKEGELYLARYAPQNIKSKESQYRYYYNFAHFYSLKAEILSSHMIGTAQEPVKTALQLCQQSMGIASQLLPQTFAQEATLPSEFVFYKHTRTDAFQTLIGDRS